MRQINALTQKVESMNNTNKTIIAGRVERDAKMIEKEKENDLLRKEVEKKDEKIIDSTNEIVLYRNEIEEGKRQMKVLTQETERVHAGRVQTGRVQNSRI